MHKMWDKNTKFNIWLTRDQERQQIKKKERQQKWQGQNWQRTNNNEIFGVEGHESSSWNVHESLAQGRTQSPCSDSLFWDSRTTKKKKGKSGHLQRVTWKPEDYQHCLPNSEGLWLQLYNLWRRENHWEWNNIHMPTIQSKYMLTFFFIFVSENK